MTCLYPNAISQSDGDQSTSNPILTSLLLQAVEHLRLQWRALGLADDPFLQSAAVRPHLERFNARKLHRILGQIMQLCEDSASCKGLAEVLQHQTLSPMEAPALASLVLELSPLLVCVPLMQQSPQPVSNGESLLSLPLDANVLSIRASNALRRNGFHKLGDLVGVDEQRLGHCRNIGATSISELHSLLAGYGLSLPFSAEAAQAIQSPEPIAVAATPQRDPALDLLVEDTINRRWCELAAACIRQKASTTPALKLIETLTSLCDSEPEALARRLGELQQLSAILQAIQSSGASSGTASIGGAAEILQRKLLECYAQKFSGVFPAGTWLRDLCKAMDRPTAVNMLLMHIDGLSLERIGSLSAPAITRERVRQKLMAVVTLVGCTIGELRDEMRRSREQQHGQQRDQLLRQWIATHGRLPYGTDPTLADLDADEADSQEPLLEVASASLQQRLQTYDALGIAVPEAEWDLHYQVICQRGRHLGMGYWHTIEPLKQFLTRSAEAQGEPGWMPLQIELPPAVHGAVTRHGGQGPVAGAVGMRYRGPLMGQGCRRYWTQERLSELLQHAAVHHGLPAGAMPSQLEIRRFMTSGTRSEYTGKPPATVILAMKGYAPMSWQDVAAKFDRYYRQEG
jgi:hypothetical protein